jgi:hypothetical protein
MGKKKNKYGEIELRRRAGYMTVDEFTKKFEFGLREYLSNYFNEWDLDVVHPEDLTSQALCYAEEVYRVTGVFGIGDSNAQV